jgi:hypothetical protein
MVFMFVDLGWADKRQAGLGFGWLLRVTNRRYHFFTSCLSPVLVMKDEVRFNQSSAKAKPIQPTQKR